MNANLSSCAGLTGASILLQKSLARKMDGRVEPGHYGPVFGKVPVLRSSAEEALNRARDTIAYTCTAVRTRPALPNTRRYRSTSAGSPVAFSGLSDSFTAGRPFTAVTLQTSEIGSRSADPSGAQPVKSLVRLVPQPKLMRTRPAKCRYVSSIEPTSIPSENTSSFSLGSRPFCFHHLMISSPAAIGGALSGLKPVQSATHSGASRKNALVPKASGSAIRRLPPYVRRHWSRIRYGARRNSSSSLASAAATIGSSCALVPIASRSESIASSTLEVPVNAGPHPSFPASTHQRCHKNP